MFYFQNKIFTTKILGRKRSFN